MNRLQIRTLLRKRIQSAGTTQWSDSELNTLIDLSAQDLQKQLLLKNAQYFATIATSNWVADKTRIPLPGGYVQDLGVLEYKSGASAEYALATHNIHLNMLAQQPEQGDTPEWTVLGRWLKIVPAPAVTVTNGIRFYFAKAITLDDDTAIPPVDLFWHEDIVNRAKRKAYSETEEQSPGTDAAVEEARRDVATVHRASNQGRASVEVQGIRKDY
jgi:hypothetical protein